MNKWFISCLMVTFIFTVSCTSTFRVSKDGKGYFLGSGGNNLYKWFCESGDLNKILSDAQLNPEKKKDLYTYNCSAEKSTLKVKQIYLSMTPEERKSLRTAFRKNGYDVNSMTC